MPRLVIPLQDETLLKLQEMANENELPTAAMARLLIKNGIQNGFHLLGGPAVDRSEPPSLKTPSRPPGRPPSPPKIKIPKPPFAPMAQANKTLPLRPAMEKDDEDREIWGGTFLDTYGNSYDPDGDLLDPNYTPLPGIFPTPAWFQMDESLRPRDIAAGMPTLGEVIGQQLRQRAGIEAEPGIYNSPGGEE